jgi:thiol-disulfide isomerase/thioredoxin
MHGAIMTKAAPPRHRTARRRGRRLSLLSNKAPAPKVSPPGAVHSHTQLWHVFMMLDYSAKFAQALPYQEFLQKHGTEAHRQRWAAVHARVALSPEQTQLLAGFTRDMYVLVMAGAWCGDCVEQCPIFEHFAHASPRIHVRYCDRDAFPDLQQALSICGGARVPVAVFLSEDGHPTGWFGDRTLTRYRKIAADQWGEVCSIGLVPPEESLMAATVQDWLNEFERNQLILRTSPRLRKKHGD